MLAKFLALISLFLSKTCLTFNRFSTFLISVLQHGSFDTQFDAFWRNLFSLASVNFSTLKFRKTDFRLVILICRKTIFSKLCLYKQVHSCHEWEKRMCKIEPPLMVISYLLILIENSNLWSILYLKSRTFNLILFSFKCRSSWSNWSCSSSWNSWGSNSSCWDWD